MSKEVDASTITLKKSMVPFLLAAAVFVLHVATNHRFGYHHDELYFIACGEHFDFGYVDHAPLVPWIARFSTEVFGQSLRGLRLLPALAGAATVLLTGLMARRLGGGSFAQATACLCAAVAPGYLRAGNMLAIPSFEPFYWALGFYLAIRIFQEDNPRLWPLVGLVAGVGLMNKHTMLFFGFGLVVAMALTPARKHFKSPWLYLGGVVALCVFLPNILWQMRHDWATLTFIRTLNRNLMAGISPVAFAAGQILYLHPVSFPIWAGGLVFLFSKARRPYRVFGYFYVVLFVLLIVIKSKIYYLMPAYTILFAAGGTWWESLVERKRWTWARPLIVAGITAGGLVFLPLGLPVLSIDKTDRYITALTFGLMGNVYELTGDLHGQFGHPELVADVAEIYRAMPESERKRCAIIASDYGQAGAIDFFGPAYGLPKASSINLSYYLWGLPDMPIETVIAVDIPRADLARFFQDIEEDHIIRRENVNPWDREIYVTVCRKPLMPPKELWKRMGSWVM